MRTYSKFIISLLLFHNILSYGSNLLIHKVNIESGLSGNYVKTIFKDSRGLMWINTLNGLNSFDGAQVNTINKRFKTPLASAIQSCMENEDGTFLIGTVTGAFTYQIKENKATNIKFGLPTVEIRTIVRSTSGTTYFSTDKGLFAYDAKQNRAYLVLPDYNAIEPGGIVEDQKHQLWLAAYSGIYCYTPGRKPAFYSFSGVTSVTNKIRSLVHIGNNIYIGTNQGLFVFDTQSRTFNPVKGLENNAILSLVTDGKETIYIGTDGAGLFTYNLSSHIIQDINVSGLNTTSAKTITALYYDHSGILWIGTFSEGVVFFNAKRKLRFDQVEFTNGPSQIGIRSLYVSPQGTKYLGSSEGFLVVNPSNQITAQHKYNPTKGLRSRIITTISPFPGKKNHLLIGTFGGGASLYDTQTNSFSSFSKDKNFQEGTVYRFAYDSRKNLWIATLNGLYKYHLPTGVIKRYDLSSILGNNDLYWVLADRSHRIWLGTKTGAYYLSPDEKHLVQPNVCKPYRYQCPVIYEDKSGDIWFCFNMGGVLQISSQLRIKSITTSASGLPDNTPFSLIEDIHGNMWASTPKGVCRISASGEIRTYGLGDGMPGLGFKPGAAETDKSGNLWWGNENGVVHYSPANDATSKVIPPIVPTDVFVNGNRISADTLAGLERVGPQKYRLSIKGKSNNNLEFRVAVLDYNNAQANQYSFRLDDKDEKWSNPSSSNMVAYNHLNTGSHTLRIKASNSDGIWTPTPLKIEFTITPYFYETTAFLLLIILLVGGSVVYFTRAYIARMKDKMKEIITVHMEESRKRQSAGSSTLKVSEDKSNQIKEKLFTYMREEKPYLNTGLKMADISASIGFPVHEISQVLNSQLNQNFSDFINSFRVEEFKRRVEKGDNAKYTLTAIAQQSGFSARSSFLRAFKKVEGTSPSDYFKNLKLSDD